MENHVNIAPSSAQFAYKKDRIAYTIIRFAYAIIFKVFEHLYCIYLDSLKIKCSRLLLPVFFY